MRLTVYIVTLYLSGFFANSIEAGETANAAHAENADSSHLSHAAHAENACRQMVELAKNRCDKYDAGHAYQNLYCGLFLNIRGAQTTMLEIGFGCGHSLGAGLGAVIWKSWFHNLHYYAVDFIAGGRDAAVNTCWADFNRTHPNVVSHLWIGDQSDVSFLGSLVTEFAAMQPAGQGQFDVIIDDGAHLYSFIKTSFQFLWPHVAPGGVYVVEDMAADYKFSRVVGKWIEKLSFGIPPRAAHDANATEVDFENTVPYQLKSITCAFQICAFTKALPYEHLTAKEYYHPFLYAAPRLAVLDP